jgi:protein-S-isoprenylcysteine O-methyltransferase Ste14
MTRANALFRWLLLNAALATLALLCAGSLNLRMLWAYLVVFAVLTLVAAFVVDSELFKERSNPGDIGLDPISGKGISVLLLATIAFAALDAGRFHWTRIIPHLTQAIALALVAVLLGLQTWAMTVNPFFSSAIRIQTERGHHLITRGPYRVIRHPGYFAMFFSTPATAIALGSAIALVPALLCSVVILRRTIHEDRFLRDQLTGYAGYMLMVRYRLFPGLW